jgi:hypothetical protein
MYFLLFLLMCVLFVPVWALLAFLVGRLLCRGAVGYTRLFMASAFAFWGACMLTVAWCSVAPSSKQAGYVFACILFGLSAPIFRRVGAAADEPPLSWPVSCTISFLPLVVLSGLYASMCLYSSQFHGP